MISRTDLMNRLNLEEAPIEVPTLPDHIKADKAVEMVTLYLPLVGTVEIGQNYINWVNSHEVQKADFLAEYRKMVKGDKTFIK